MHDFENKHSTRQYQVAQYMHKECARVGDIGLQGPAPSHLPAPEEASTGTECHVKAMLMLQLASVCTHKDQRHTRTFQLHLATLVV